MPSTEEKFKVPYVVCAKISMACYQMYYTQQGYFSIILTVFFIIKKVQNVPNLIKHD